MFIGDANHRASSIRPGSIKCKGLRFWWRAINWRRVLRETGGDSYQALRLLHANEARLFGSAAGDNGGGQGLFLLSVKSGVLTHEQQPSANMTGAQLYLLGQGLGTRDAFVAGEFTLRLLFKAEATEEDRRQIGDAVLAFGLLGALGGRERHGMGSVAITALSGCQHSVPKNKEEYKKALATFFFDLPESLPPFTAFSKLSRCDISAEARNPLALLTTIGREMQMYRSYGFGKDRKVYGEKVDQIFGDDHHLILRTAVSTIDRAPRRTVFGLPHNYRYSNNYRVNINYLQDGKNARRASPLLLHIHRLPDGTCLAMHTLMPAVYLPDKAKIRISGKVSSSVPFQPKWEVIHTFLDRFKSKEKLYG